jgi:nucleoid-associated protein YgaU
VFDGESDEATGGPVMGAVQQAVLEFDEEILAPWRPRLVVVAGQGGPGAPGPLRPRPSGRSSSRVGICRPPEPLGEAVAPPARGGRDVPIARPAAGSAGRGVVHRPSGRRAPAAHLRLTRRARLLGSVLLLALGLAIGSWAGPLLAGSDGDLRLAGVQSVVVQPGDTLWSIAGEVSGDGDVREVVDRIQELNGLSGTVLIPGQVLELP